MTATATLPRRELAAAVRWAIAGIPRNPGLPILAAVQVILSDGQVTVISHADGEARRVTCDGDGDGDAEVLADGKSLAKALTGLPGRQATIPVTLTAGAPGSGYLDITSMGMTVSPPASAPDQQYPPLPLVNGPAGMPADPAGFAAIAATAASCAARDRSIPVLEAVQVTATGGQLVLIGADRYHLYRAATSWDGPDIAPLLLPARAIASFLAATDGSPVIMRAERPPPGNVIPIRKTPPPTVKWRAGPWAELADGTRSLFTRAITGPGAFPDITRLIRAPDRNDTLISVDAAAFSAAVFRAAKVIGEHGELRIVTAAGQAGVHAIGARNDDQTTEHVPATTEGPPAVIHCTARKLLHMTSRASGTVRLGITGDRPDGDGRPAVPQVVMVYGAGWIGSIQPSRNPRHQAGNPVTARPLAAVAALPQQQHATSQGEST